MAGRLTRCAAAVSPQPGILQAAGRRVRQAAEGGARGDPRGGSGGEGRRDIPRAEPTYWFWLWMEDDGEDRVLPKDGEGLSEKLIAERARAGCVCAQKKVMECDASVFQRRSAQLTAR